MTIDDYLAELDSELKAGLCQALDQHNSRLPWEEPDERSWSLVTWELERYKQALFETGQRYRLTRRWLRWLAAAAVTEAAILLLLAWLWNS
jgi:hypothetical protein